MRFVGSEGSGSRGSGMKQYERRDTLDQNLLGVCFNFFFLTSYLLSNISWIADVNLMCVNCQVPDFNLQQLCSDHYKGNISLQSCRKHTTG